MDTRSHWRDESRSIRCVPQNIEAPTSCRLQTHRRITLIAAEAIARRWTDVEAYEGRHVGNVRLTLGGMFEAAIGDGAQKFALQQEITETGRVNTDVAALLVRATARNSQVTLLGRITIGSGRGSGGGGRGGGLELLIGVVDQIFFVRHGDS